MTPGKRLEITYASHPNVQDADRLREVYRFLLTPKKKAAAVGPRPLSHQEVHPDGRSP